MYLMSLVIEGYLRRSCHETLPTDPNAKNDHDDSALHVACSNSSDEDITEIVKLIIERYYATYSRQHNIDISVAGVANT